MTIDADTRFGHYHILSPLGAGGMGEVWRARDTRLNREVAIKILPAEFAKDADRLKRFEQEARATSALSHPNILTVHDIGDYEGAPFIVAELLEGGELREQLKGCPLPVRTAIDYAQQIASGLAAAHAKGIVHRDLKPENLFITTDGRVKILDFGLAKLKPPQTHAVDTDAPTQKKITDPGTVLGTVGYMSPEQVRGQEADHRSDIFSFGMILYEMLSGKRAFNGDSVADVMSAILKEEPPELGETNAKISPALEKIVRRCLEKKPERRFQTASDLGFALETLSGASASSQPESIAAPVSAPARSQRWRRLIIPLSAMLFVVAALGVFFVGQRTGKTAPPMFRQLSFRRGTVWNARFAPDGQIVYSATWNGKPMELFATRADSLEPRSLGLTDADILAVSSTGALAVLRNRHYLGQYVSRGTLAVMTHPDAAPRDLVEDVQEADWSPDGKYLAVVRYVSGRNRLEYPVGTNLYETPGWLSYPRISPNGDSIAFLESRVQWANDGVVTVINLAGQKKTVLSEQYAWLDGLAWSPTGDEVWFGASKNGEAEALRAVTLQRQERVVARAPTYLQLKDISRNGHVLAASTNYSTDVIGLAPGETKERDLCWFNNVMVQSLSEDGKSFVFVNQGEGGGTNLTTYLRKTDGPPAVRLGEGLGETFSPDGKWVLSFLLIPEQLILLPTGAGDVKRIETHGIEHYTQAYWLPDGKRLVFSAREPGRGMLCYIQAIESGALRPLTPEGIVDANTGYGLGINGSLVSPDGRFLVVLDAQRKHFLYPIEGGDSPHPIPGLENEDHVIRWSGDGHSLFVYRRSELPIKVFRLDLSTGRKTPLLEVMPADKDGIVFPPWIQLTPDGKSYVYEVLHQLADLYLIEGTK